MPFLSLDEGFADHPKVWALSDNAFRVHVSGLLLCSRLKTDGFLPADRIRNLVPKLRPASVPELLDGTRWAPVGIDELVVSYEIRNYLDWNLSAAAIQERREKAAKRKADFIAKQNGGHNAD